MIEIKNVSIFKCEFCGKKSFRKCDTTRHEKFCRKNPINNHLCFNECRNLVRSEEEYAGYDYIGKKSVFTCGLSGQRMFSYIAERKRLPVVNEKDAVRMPLICDKYAIRTTEDYFGDLSF
jgi:hypothetical protein